MSYFHSKNGYNHLLMNLYDVPPKLGCTKMLKTHFKVFNIRIRSYNDLLS